MDFDARDWMGDEPPQGIRTIFSDPSDSSEEFGWVDRETLAAFESTFGAHDMKGASAPREIRTIFGTMKSTFDAREMMGDSAPPIAQQGQQNRDPREAWKENYQRDQQTQWERERPQREREAAQRRLEDQRREEAERQRKAAELQTWQQTYHCHVCKTPSPGPQERTVTFQVVGGSPSERGIGQRKEVMWTWPKELYYCRTCRYWTCRKCGDGSTCRCCLGY